MSSVPSDQENLDKARIALGKVLDGITHEYSESGERQVLLSEDKLMDIIDRFERKIASKNSGSASLYQRVSE